MPTFAASWSRFFAWSAGRPTWIKAALAVFLATIFESSAPVPVGDAYFYWYGALKFAHIQSPWIIGQLSLRGVWSSALYIPAALLSRLFSGTSGDFFILVENAVALGLVAGLVLPAIIGQWRPVTPRLTWVTAGITWLIFGRYAPYALLDLLEVVMVLGAAVLLTKQSRWVVGVAGALLFILVDVQAAYLPEVVLIALIALWFRRQATWPAFVGAALAAIPQTVINLSYHYSWKPWAPATGSLSAMQALWASFFVRYDTDIAGTLPGPSVTWCDPHTASVALHDPPGSTFGLLIFYLKHLPSSVPFVVEKLGSVLSWPLAAPYYTSSPISNVIFTGLIMGVAVVGAICLASRLPRTQLQASVWAIWIGCVILIIASAPETRFSLPIVCCGIVGVMSRPVWTARKSWLAVGLIALLAAAAIVGMQHPINVDATTAAQCIHS
jgi:hypothetical protein